MGKGRGTVKAVKGAVKDAVEVTVKEAVKAVRGGC